MHQSNDHESSAVAGRTGPDGGAVFAGRQAANARDLETMSRLFGTDEGPIGDSRGREEVELRMDVIAEILRHDNYQIISERPVPGAQVPSIRIGVDMSLPGGTTVQDVGFTVVLEPPDRWLVNVIEVTKITGAE